MLRFPFNLSLLCLLRRPLQLSFLFSGISKEFEIQRRVLRYFEPNLRNSAISFQYLTALLVGFKDLCCREEMENERFKRAVKAMTILGLSPNAVIPQLKRLLEVYDNDWTLIEEECYRALADAIFESQDSVEKQPQSKKRKRKIAVSSKKSSSFASASDEDEDDVIVYSSGEEVEVQETLALVRRKRGKPFRTANNSANNGLLVEPVTSDRENDAYVVPALCWHQDNENNGCSKKSRAESSEYGVRSCNATIVIRENGNLDHYDENSSTSLSDVSSLFDHLPALSAAVKLISPSSFEAFGRLSQDKTLCLRGSEVTNHRASARSSINAHSGREEEEFASDSSPGTLENLQHSQNKKIQKIVKMVESCAIELFHVLMPEVQEMKLMEMLCTQFLRSPNILSKHAEAQSSSLLPARSNNEKSVIVIANGESSRLLHNVEDISNGHEQFPIPVNNEGAREPFPSQFRYIKNNLIYQNAYVRFSLARIGDENCCSDCSGNCLENEYACPCARETGGEYAYTIEGLLKKEFLEAVISRVQNPQPQQHFYCEDCPLERSNNKVKPGTCKGHLIQRFIKECWSKCRCNKKCGNRVVQRGINRKLEVFYTPEGKGWGVRALEKIPRGAFVCEYVGEIVTNTELYERNNERHGSARHTYPVLLDADWGSEGVLKDEEALCLDATCYGNVARFINHRCSDANLMEIPVEIESPDHHYYHLAFFTVRDVNEYEELTWDYGLDFSDKQHPIKAFDCLCGSERCMNLKRLPRRRKTTS